MDFSSAETSPTLCLCVHQILVLLIFKLKNCRFTLVLHDTPPVLLVQINKLGTFSWLQSRQNFQLLTMSQVDSAIKVINNSFSFSLYECGEYHKSWHNWYHR